MPSSNKTGHLRLNSWTGSDKPKKDDFNSDNTLVDAACRELDERVCAVEPVRGAVAEHTANTAIHLSESERGAWGAHIADTVAHITAAERALWSAGGGNMTLGSYTGTGASSRKITLGFRPRFGVVFGVGVGIADADLVNLESRMFAGFFSTSGCSKNLVVMSDGFTVLHTTGMPIDKLTYRYNETDIKYVYAAWPE